MSEYNPVATIEKISVLEDQLTHLVIAGKILRPEIFCRLLELSNEIDKGYKDLWPTETRCYGGKYIWNCYWDRDSAGVYFLWDSSGLDYIGKAKNIGKRLRSHGVYHRHHLVGVIPCADSAERSRIEKELIRTLKPPRNIQYIPRK